MKKTELAKNVIQFQDDSILKDGSQSTIFLTSRGPIIIDTFGMPEQWKYVQDFIFEQGYKKPYMIIYTHGHLDHVLGHQSKHVDFPIIAHQKTSEVMEEHKKQFLKHYIEQGYLSEDTFLVHPNLTFKEKMELQVDDFHFQFIYTPFHSVDSITIYEKQSQLIFTGDNYLTLENKYYLPDFKFLQGIDKTNNQFLNSLEKVRQLGGNILVQGHGPAINKSNYIHLIDTYVDSIIKTAKLLTKEEDIDNIKLSDLLANELLNQIFNIEGEHDTLSTNFKKIYTYLKK